MFEKLKGKSLLQLGIKAKVDEKSFDYIKGELEKQTTQELYDINKSMYKTISMYNIDNDFKIKYDVIIKILKDRASTQ